MSIQPVLIDGIWEKASSSAKLFSVTNPKTKIKLDNQYPVSVLSDIEKALKASHKAIEELHSKSSDNIANFLESFADNINFRSEELIKTASLETSLPAEPRLRSVELPRTIDQLRQAAYAARDKSWCSATIDTKAKIRSKYASLPGPVVIFSPNNFPFAFNSCAGGDFASAIAAGNPVIAIANQSQPGTTKIFAETALMALKTSGLPQASVQMFYHLKQEDCIKLVSHPLVGATAFTGSQSFGLRLKEAADRAGKPIYLEMSSINPVIILPGALKERLEEIALEFYNSCTLGVGQFCTKPGLIILIQDEKGESFLQKTMIHFQSGMPGILLNEKVLNGLISSIGRMQQYGAKIVTGAKEVHGKGYCFSNTLLRISGEKFLNHPEELQIETFGPLSLFVFAKDFNQLKKITSLLNGNLTGTIYSHSKDLDDILYSQIEPILRKKVGRLLNDKMPTGVAVSPAMHHGGPFPSTGHPGFTSVGIPASLIRFASRECYDNVRQNRLPLELQNRNPTGRMWRFIDGKWSQKDI
ncbi:MAG: aldehyde dehydrogenase family protein [Candidatus Aminicenantes bacterium]|nr:aldehyde dehydrogenase family protein [Candidatus Aminicenantes bacterium]